MGTSSPFAKGDKGGFSEASELIAQERMSDYFLLWPYKKKIK
jgi:hypothetical protein